MDDLAVECGQVGIAALEQTSGYGQVQAGMSPGLDTKRPRHVLDEDVAWSGDGVVTLASYFVEALTVTSAPTINGTGNDNILIGYSGVKLNGATATTC